jgi:hypothetical protein
MQINHHSWIWLRNVAKCGKYSLAKFANFVYFCIACGNCYHIWAAFYNISQSNFAILLILVC